MKIKIHFVTRLFSYFKFVIHNYTTHVKKIEITILVQNILNKIKLER